VTWTVSDGERGRRWREAVAEPAGGMARSMTLETGHAGQWLRLEMAAPAGLLSLHPDREGSIHGNVASADGVRDVALGVLRPPLVDVRDSLVGETALDLLPRRLAVRILVAARRRERRAPLGKLRVGNENVGGALAEVDAHAISCPEQRQTTAGRGLG